MPAHDERSPDPGSPQPVRAPRGARRPRRLIVPATVALVVALAAVAAIVRSYGAPRAVANSVVGAPFVRTFNYVRERTYFAPDDGCLRELGAAGIEAAFVANPPHRDHCPLRNVVRVLPTGLLRRPLYMTCRLARSLHRFDRLILQPAAERYLGQPVARLAENGVRNCRTVAGYDALLSEHAFANAIDVSGFVLRDGTTIDVAAERSTTGPRADFVRSVTAGACTIFNTVLGPGFDERHGDHLHLDMGLLGGCRP